MWPLVMCNIKFPFLQVHVFHYVETSIMHYIEKGILKLCLHDHFYFVNLSQDSYSRLAVQLKYMFIDLSKIETGESCRRCQKGP